MEVKCYTCAKNKHLTEISYKRAVAKRGQYYCQSCIAKNAAKDRPQNTKEYWADPNVKRRHSETVKASPVFQRGIANRKDTSGANNNMFGKQHTVTTKQKMSKSRTGKTGSNATAWKGGKTSFYRRLRFAIERSTQWTKRVLERDGYKCTSCSSSKQLDAHHIIPFKTLYDDLSKMCHIEDESARMMWFISRKELTDPLLTNGSTLCRSCHRIEHQNWGSHMPRANNVRN